jgi:hypothetical protein
MTKHLRQQLEVTETLKPLALVLKKQAHTPRSYATVLHINGDLACVTNGYALMTAREPKTATIENSTFTRDGYLSQVKFPNYKELLSRAITQSQIEVPAKQMENILNGLSASHPKGLTPFFLSLSRDGVSVTSKESSGVFNPWIVRDYLLPAIKSAKKLDKSAKLSLHFDDKDYQLIANIGPYTVLCVGIQVKD